MMIENKLEIVTRRKKLISGKNEIRTEVQQIPVRCLSGKMLNRSQFVPIYLNTRVYLAKFFQVETRGRFSN
jgi:hypothetical protein